MILPQTGDVFESNYLLTEKLGEGGFAVVYRARDTGIAARDVAIKVLKPGADGRYAPDIVARFRREVQVLSQLRDQHSVTLYQYGETSTGLLFLVFEHVLGRDLSTVLDEVGRMDRDETIHILRQVLQALSEAHALNLLHRDIKPDNIRVFEHLGDPRRVKLLDFGIAKDLLDGSSSVTKTGELVGTLRYMSPEQLTDHELGPASDIYSLGIVGFQMAMGNDAVHGTGWGEQIERLRTGHIFSVPELERLGGLDVVLQKMSARNPRHRYQSAAEVLSALDALQASPAAHGPQPPAPTVTASGPRVAPAILTGEPERISTRSLGLVLALVFVLLAAAGAYLVAASQQPQVPDPRPPVLVPPKPSRVVKPTVDAPAPDVGAPDSRFSGASPGCGKKSRFEGRIGTLSIMDGLARVQWQVYVPKEYDENRSYPVMLLFHQDSRSGTTIIEQTRFHELADKKGLIVIAPGGEVIAWRHQDDVSLVPTILRESAAELCLDPTRIYAVGHGVGGRAVEYLSCEHDWITGIATNSHRPSSNEFHCSPARAVPIIQFSPTKSARLPAEGGMGCGGMERISLEAAEKLWRGRNKCAAKRTEHIREGENVCWTWECETKMISCHVAAPHSWPGSPIKEMDLMRCDSSLMSDFPATKMIWEFFESLEPRGDETSSPW